MKSYQMTIAIDAAKKALESLAWLDFEQLVFIKRLVNEGITELIIEAHDAEAKKAKEEEKAEIEAEMSDIAKELESFWEGK